MLLASDLPPVRPMYANHAVVSYDAGRSGISSLTSGHPIGEVKVGPTKYLFRVPSRGYFLPAGPSSPGEFYVDCFSPDIVGRGATPSAAQKNWEEELHREFQRLYAMRDWEMDATDKRRWQRISEWIDVDLYRNTTPMVGREIGRINRMAAHKKIIQWVDGRRERFELSRVPGQFAAFTQGTWFEAEVERDGLTGSFRRILCAQKIDSLDALSLVSPDDNRLEYERTDHLPEATL